MCYDPKAWCQRISPYFETLYDLKTMKINFRMRYLLFTNS